MTRQQFIEMMSNPGLLNEQTLEQIREVIEEYPFFQTGRMLWMKNLHILGHIKYNNELKLAAAHIADRGKLFELINENAGKLESVMPDEIDVDKGIQEEWKENEQIIDRKEQIKVKLLNEDEAFETAVEEQRDISDILQNENDDIRYAFPLDSDNIVLPSADLLDYEMAGTANYQLAEYETTPNLDESRTFYEWLNLLKQQSVEIKEKEHKAKISTEKDKKMSLIDNFLERGERKRIVTDEKEFENIQPEDFSKKSLQENTDIMTETLANIYIKQKHYSKAIDIFEQLRLKYPEKNIYFAHRIKELEEQINRNNK